jgi:hypothetical protein
MAIKQPLMLCVEAVPQAQLVVLRAPLLRQLEPEAEPLTPSESDSDAEELPFHNFQSLLLLSSFQRRERDHTLVDESWHTAWNEELASVSTPWAPPAAVREPKGENPQLDHEGSDVEECPFPSLNLSESASIQGQSGCDICRNEEFFSPLSGKASPEEHIIECKEAKEHLQMPESPKLRLLEPEAEPPCSPNCEDENEATQRLMRPFQSLGLPEQLYEIHKDHQRPLHKDVEPSAKKVLQFGAAKSRSLFWSCSRRTQGKRRFSGYAVSVGANYVATFGVLLLM